LLGAVVDVCGVVVMGALDVSVARSSLGTVTSSDDGPTGTSKARVAVFRPRAEARSSCGPGSSGMLVSNAARPITAPSISTRRSSGAFITRNRTRESFLSRSCACWRANFPRSSSCNRSARSTTSPNSTHALAVLPSVS